MNRCCQLSERVDFALAGCDPATGVRPSAGERILLTRKAAAKLVGNVRTTMRQFEVCLRHFIAWVQTDARLPHRANGSGGGRGSGFGDGGGGVTDEQSMRPAYTLERSDETGEWQVRHARVTECM
jgi:hypothetical protein